MTPNHPGKNLIILLHEIYGVNDHMKFYSDLMIEEGFDVIVPKLIGREAFSYDQEDQAYHYFMNEIGFAGAHRHVCNIVDQNRDEYERIFIIGFSVGATIAWMTSGHGVDGIVGFYGSRIRNYTEIEPACASLLFFAKHEKSFNALDLQQKLRDKQNAYVEMIDAEHGFMNPYHDAYNFNEYHQCLKRCKDFLKQTAG